MSARDSTERLLQAVAHLQRALLRIGKLIAFEA
jgi:hypothetical protein